MHVFAPVRQALSVLQSFRSSLAQALTARNMRYGGTENQIQSTNARPDDSPIV
jgi:hypothetical protein